MGEAIGVTGIALGTIGFALTVRNGVERFLTDAHAWHTFGERLIPLGEELTSQIESLKAWQEYWYLDDFTPTYILEAYWGRNGTRRVLHLLHNTRHVLERIQATFRKHHNVEDALLYQDDLLAPTSSTAGQANQDFMDRMHRFRESHFHYNKLRNILWRGSIFEMDLKSLATSILTLQTLSENLFRTRNFQTEGIEIHRKAGEIAASEYTWNLSQSLKDMFPDLRKCIAKSSPIICDVHLRPGPDCIDGLNDIIESAKTRVIPFSFHLDKGCNDSDGKGPCDHLPGQTSGIVCVQYEPVSTRSEEALLLLGKDTYGITKSKYIFQEQTMDCQWKPARSLRSSFFSNIRAANYSSRTRKIQVQYEITQACFILFATPLVHQICTCAILQEVTSGSLLSANAIRILGLQEHHAGVEDLLCHGQSWCQAETSIAPFLRLGIVLAEITLGFKAESHSMGPEVDGRAIEIDINLDVLTKHQKQQILRLLTKIQLIDDSDDVIQAILFCFQHHPNPSRLTKDDFMVLYENVLFP